MPIDLVPAQPQDQQWLEQLRRAVYRELFFATWGEWDEARHLRHCMECWERANISLIQIEGVKVGMLQVADEPDAMKICEIQIATAHQNQGIGTQVLRDLIATAHMNSKNVSLQTGLQNQRALRLYLRLGFTQVGTTDTHILLECSHR